jgi:hypothetical protein
MMIIQILFHLYFQETRMKSAAFNTAEVNQQSWETSAETRKLVTSNSARSETISPRMICRTSDAARVMAARREQIQRGKDKDIERRF